ncbi:MAG TPA: PA0069 family radical SAM protein [Elusimicrobiota bacterium]|nr:PA0069 family radical SAM protein [Elusimicrobiota bacterium]
MKTSPFRLTGRGADTNPRNRFSSTHSVPEPEDAAPPDLPPKTRFLRDTSRRVISCHHSPDLGYGATLNPYRGCEHGCVYCFARPTHEYLDRSAGLDFESVVFIKHDAARLLRRELGAPRWEPRTVAMCGVTDPYQPIERRRELTRECLKVFLEFRNPVTVTTKNQLVTRDRDILSALAGWNAAAVFISVTTLDEELCRRMEPRTSRPAHRLEAVKALAQAGIPVGVNVAPVIPGLTDHELPAILKEAALAGAKYAWYAPVRLPYGVGELFERWIEKYFPDRKNKILGRLRSLHGGKLNDSSFGARLRGRGVYADELEGLFRLSCRRLGLRDDGPALSAASFRRPVGRQLALFSGSASDSGCPGDVEMIK